MRKILIAILLTCVQFGCFFETRAGISRTTVNDSIYDAVVATDASGDFRSIQQAVDQAPQHRQKPYLIYVKNGHYNEVVVIPQAKSFIHLIGQDKQRTIIHYKLNVQALPKPDSKWYKTDTAAWKFSVHNPQAPVYRFPGSVVTVQGDDFYAENISFINDWGLEQQSGPQSLAMCIQADRAAFNNCIFRSFQDTWMTSTRKPNDRLYVYNCWIEGAVDYFYGGGNAYVEHSTLYNVRSGSIMVAPSHKEETKWGYVFNHCIIDGNQAAADGKIKLGRPWHHRPKTVFLHTKMKIPVAAEGWTDMGGIPSIFADYKSIDATGRTIDIHARKTHYKNRNNETGVSKAVLSDVEAASYTYDQVILGDDQWNPRKFIVSKTVTWD
ncbi:pectin esterase [Sphingobacterium sp. N143]|nr:pectin esterase [Sphingobacterium sp. N143]